MYLAIEKIGLSLQKVCDRCSDTFADKVLSFILIFSYSIAPDNGSLIMAHVTIKTSKNEKKSRKISKKG